MLQYNDEIKANKIVYYDNRDSKTKHADRQLKYTCKKMLLSGVSKTVIENKVKKVYKKRANKRDILLIDWTAKRQKALSIAKMTKNDTEN